MRVVLHLVRRAQASARIAMRDSVPMPTVKNPAALKKAYDATMAKLSNNDIPTTMIAGGHSLFRAVNPLTPYPALPKPAAGGSVSMAATLPLLKPADIGREGNNRF